MNFTSYKDIKFVMDKFHIAPQKRFGQNFLMDNNVLEQIADGAIDKEGMNVLEVGPGMGALTTKLARDAKKVVCVEIDKGMIEVLKYTLEDVDNVTVVEGDILEEDVLKEATSKFFGPFAVVANLPYYITTPIIMAFLESDLPVSSLVLMMQKEVAKRICARPSTKEYGILSLAVQYYADTKILFNVSAGCFWPKPNVESCVIRLDIKDKPAVEVLDEKLFFNVIKASFSMRRKTLINNLAGKFKLDKEQTTLMLNQLEIDPSRRGETLNLQEFANIANKFYQINK